MSKVNINQDYFKVTGRDPGGKRALPVHPLERQQFRQNRSEVEAASAKKPPIPGTAGKGPKTP